MLVLEVHLGLVPHWVTVTHDARAVRGEGGTRSIDAHDPGALGWWWQHALGWVVVNGVTNDCTSTSVATTMTWSSDWTQEGISSRAGL